MANDPNLEEQLVILDQNGEIHEDRDRARQLAERLGLPYDPLDEFHVDANPAGEHRAEDGGTDRRAEWEERVRRAAGHPRPLRRYHRHRDAHQRREQQSNAGADQCALGRLARLFFTRVRIEGLAPCYEDHGRRCDQDQFGGSRIH